MDSEFGILGVKAVPKTSRSCNQPILLQTGYKGKSLGSSAVRGTYVWIDTTSPNQDTTIPGAKQLAFWTQLQPIILGTDCKSHSYLWLPWLQTSQRDGVYEWFIFGTPSIRD